jgi:hypothetical protein
MNTHGFTVDDATTIIGGDTLTADTSTGRKMVLPTTVYRGALTVTNPPQQPTRYSTESAAENPTERAYSCSYQPTKPTPNNNSHVPSPQFKQYPSRSRGDESK